MATMQTSLGVVSYTDEGSGPPIVLLHAALHDRTDFAPVTEALEKGRRMLTLDWPGHGESPLPTTPLRAVEFGDLLVEFADRLDLSNTVIVGNSVGGYAAAGWRWSDPSVSPALCSSTTAASPRTLLLHGSSAR